MINIPFLIFLAATAGATVFFSMFNSPGIRGYRNLGFLLIYAGSVIGMFCVGWRPVCVAWIGFGIVSGTLYFLYQMFSTLRSKDEPKEWPSPMTIAHGLAMWPIMLPEVIEYTLADIGILGTGEVAATESENDPDESQKELA